MKTINLIIIVILAAFSAPSSYAEEAEVWFDKAREHAGDGADDMAQWFDSFFGDQQTESDRFAETYLRVIARSLLYQNSDSSQHLRVRGNIKLPNLSHRLELIFEDSDAGSDETDTVPGAGAEDVRAGIKWNWLDNDAIKLDLTAHWRDSGLRPGVRFRQQKALSDKVLFQWYHRFDYGKDGWETSSDFAFDRKLGPDRLIRWRNRIDTSIGREPAHWRSVLQFRSMQGDGVGEIGRQWFVGLSGTGSRTLSEMTKTIGFTWRRSFWRDYLWFEVEPRYIWNSEACECNTAGIQVKAEVLLFDPD